MADPASNNETQSSFADSILGKIIVGIAIAAASALISWIVARATHVPPKPDAQITPSELIAPARELVEFAASDSFVPSNSTPTYDWKVSGLDLNESPVGHCTTRDAVIACRFTLPGTFAVSVEVTDANGQSDTAAASVTVSIPNGYLGLVFPATDERAFESILYDIDWPKLQSLITRPIVLIDPLTNTPLYASQVERPKDAGNPPSWKNAANGLKVAIPRFSSAVQQEFELAFLEIGITPTFMPFNEVFTASQTGAIDLGFISLETPTQLQQLNE